MSNNHEIVVPTETHGHVHRDDVGARMGMWLFLFTELLLFGGMFLIYGVYRFQYSEEFHFAAMELNTGIGTLNTIVLLTSSLTVALSISALQKKNKFLSVVFLSLTIVFALAFMVNKFFEWSAKFSHGIYPGSEDLINKSNGEVVFFGLYYVMTGIHGLHIVIGVILLSFILVFLIRDKITPDNFVKLENAGLYWHLVDLIWIFLFPLFYLIQ
ncbi:MAG: cytochrome c oxidase subunit 3 [Melioribacteraceae bacterium]|nr:cytochrome c oxidase subunit 3 [Melioribacteraceae bacterium]MCF8264012.1 cytochrome c oxidase subunit 3 [Melioribacteraceae bacterium]MCF8412696.1 cytochrome c oxidase subunit 3 [Melioribacteraceae bacterium]MCF8431785.1 cytochrome c oxidase subunit 3 [Melioribacteraceae bacterium]